MRSTRACRRHVGEDTMDKNAWKHAVVHLEGAGDTIPPMHQFDEMHKEMDAYDRGELDPRDFLRPQDHGSRAVRSRGTAIFFHYNTLRYLLTARHVVSDPEYASIFSSGMPLFVQAALAEMDWVYPIFFRGPTVDELQRFGEPRYGKLVNLMAGPVHPFTLSEPDEDLAVISLDRAYPPFADELLEREYVPCGMDDLSSDPVEMGAEVYSWGFPVGSVEERDLHPAAQHWASSAVGNPQLATGNVTDVMYDGPFFESEIPVEHGNSGGAIVQHGKLKGLVLSRNEARVRAVRTEELLKLLGVQFEKDEFLKHRGAGRSDAQ